MAGKTRTFGRQSKKSGFQGREVTDPLKAVEGKIGQRPEIAGQTEKKKGRPAVSRIYAVDFTRFLRDLYSCKLTGTLLCHNQLIFPKYL